MEMISIPQIGRGKKQFCERTFYILCYSKVLSLILHFLFLHCLAMKIYFMSLVIITSQNELEFLSNYLHRFEKLVPRKLYKYGFNAEFK